MNWLEHHKEPVTLHSGQLTHWLVRGDLLFEYEDLREEILDTWERAVRFRLNAAKDDHGWEIIGVPRGGLVWADALRERLGDPGELINPMRIIVDDVCTTGGSLAEYAPYNIACVAVKRIEVTLLDVVAWATIPLPRCGR